MKSEKEIKVGEKYYFCVTNRNGRNETNLYRGECVGIVDCERGRCGNMIHERLPLPELFTYLAPLENLYTKKNDGIRKLISILKKKVFVSQEDMEYSHNRVTILEKALNVESQMNNADDLFNKLGDCDINSLSLVDKLDLYE